MATPTVVITCAGSGTRLGLKRNKSLLEINGRPLIHWQLQMFQNIDDLRIVVGYQAHDVIDAVLQVRPDPFFIFNTHYSETKTAASLFLGARHAKERVIELCGDLLVHPDDMRDLLSLDGQWLGYSDRTSEQAVPISLGSGGEVLSFDDASSPFEWAGVCCLRREHIAKAKGHVYEMVSANLPVRGVKVRSFDIDTLKDYERVCQLVAHWYS